MTNETVKWLSRIQLVIEVVVAAGFLLGLIPFVYAWSGGFVLPLTVISLVLAFVLGNGTGLYTIINVVLALLSFVPVLGFVTRIAGAFVSLLSINAIRRRIG
ncbi:hypothetical protein SD70_21955 [Gordoniibacillus kamchatkensis]|uniref:Uncharacterized protein n=1 Tax=Gordoniibacillus kamchatkensis TaxID=1590651 RepID=A0ABR5ADK3_9BACL|nr:hypothetical protein [Paenibacillus sp. VKM B-2647]KIL39103.1 hypothetical protein SD70_21955 [Paenibacillus sp. VKM B-2647]